MAGALSRVKRSAISAGGGLTIDALLRTTRQEIIHGEQWEREFILHRRPAVYVLWHGRLLPCAYRHRGRGIGTMISRNRDGEYITGVIERWGYRVIRGSSSRGGLPALKAVVRILRDGGGVALTPDGPRGPRQKMKLGPLQAARMSGAPLVPVSAGAVRGWYFGSWDRFLVPKPFTWVPVAFGEPLYVPRDTPDEMLPTLATAVEERLNTITELVDEAAGARR